MRHQSRHQHTLFASRAADPLVWQWSPLFLWRDFPATTRGLHGSEGASPAPGSRGGQSELPRTLASTVVGSEWGRSLYEQGSILGLTLGLTWEMLPFRWDWSSVIRGPVVASGHPGMKSLPEKGAPQRRLVRWSALIQPHVRPYCPILGGFSVIRANEHPLECEPV